jgi:hypothetical protein
MRRMLPSMERMFVLRPLKHRLLLLNEGGNGGRSAANSRFEQLNRKDAEPMLEVDIRESGTGGDLLLA